MTTGENLVLGQGKQLPSSLSHSSGSARSSRRSSISSNRCKQERLNLAKQRYKAQLEKLKIQTQHKFVQAQLESDLKKSFVQAKLDYLEEQQKIQSAEVSSQASSSFRSATV